MSFLKQLKLYICKPYVWYQQIAEQYRKGALYQKLSQQYGDLETKLLLAEELPKIKTALEENIRACESLKISREEMIENSRRNAPSNQALEEWKHTELNPLKKELEHYTRELDISRGAAFRLAMSATIESNSSLQKIPFVYYDIINQKSVSTPAAFTLLGVQEDPDKLTRKAILRYIGREYRKEIEESLRKKRRLRRYTARTNTNKELSLSTYFFEHLEKPVGIGIFLYDQLFSTQTINVFRLVRHMETIMRLVSEELTELGYVARTGKSPSPLATDYTI